MNTIAKRNLTEIKAAILKTVPVEQMYLFGSYAVGKPHKDSDLDIYVVISDDTPYRATDAISIIYNAIYDKKTMPVDILVSKKSQFEDRRLGPTIEKEVAANGKLLYG
ncbi:hypothetical protein FACS189461_1100 [Spirochaetia bacterium]|nr:hypothetical protein FACS189461_1100 [Spirochaetia bacterium]